MSELSEFVVAATGAATVVGPGLVWVYHKIERKTAAAKRLVDTKLEKIENALEACHSRELKANARRGKLMQIVEMLLDESRRLAVDKVTPALARAKKMLKELQNETDDDR